MEISDNLGESEKSADNRSLFFSCLCLCVMKKGFFALLRMTTSVCSAASAADCFFLGAAWLMDTAIRWYLSHWKYYNWILSKIRIEYMRR